MLAYRRAGRCNLPLICREVTYKYNSRQPAVIHGLSFKINPGEAAVLGGPNGSGKSTLLKILAGLYQPTKGQIEIDNQLLGKKNGQLLPGVGLVLANPEHYFFAATVEDEIAYGLQNKGVKRSQLRNRVVEVLEYVGLGSEFLTRNPFYLSLGEQRKVGIASVLILKPLYLLLDEPFSNMDSEGSVNLARYLTKYVMAGNSVVISSHRADEVISWCQRLLVLETGELRYDGSLVNWQQHPQMPVLLGEAAYLRYSLAACGINIDYSNDPQSIAAQIVQAWQGGN